MLRSKGFIKFMFVAAVAVTVAPVFVACGSNNGTSPQSKIITEDLEVTPSAATLPAAFGKTVAFSSGISAFGIDTPATLTFSANTADASKPAFTLIAGGDTATGTISFDTAAAARLGLSKAAAVPSKWNIAEVRHRAPEPTLWIILPQEFEEARPFLGWFGSTVGLDAVAGAFAFDMNFTIDGDQSEDFEVTGEISEDGEITVGGVNLGDVEVVDGTGAN